VRFLDLDRRVPVLGRGEVVEGLADIVSIAHAHRFRRRRAPDKALRDPRA
jgi:hypothetical protein